ncbi:hypothetical protein [Bacillus solimangrovi]|uniref:Uncharacterized protein n=1 Tax=Bacillus solimangrovi TaxID=1305675 RepID=A0A1E5LJI1_9BACI|nr:hypothetical protein [Bacillus solimangrovi]OEH94240.1 hypothetical protein BFG57_09330 [Bacillus solimangrovi]
MSCDNCNFGPAEISIEKTTTQRRINVDDRVNVEYFTETGWIDVEKCVCFRVPRILDLRTDVAELFIEKKLPYSYMVLGTAYQELFSEGDEKEK